MRAHKYPIHSKQAFSTIKHMVEDESQHKAHDYDMQRKQRDNIGSFRGGNPYLVESMVQNPSSTGNLEEHTIEGQFRGASHGQDVEDNDACGKLLWEE